MRQYATLESGLLAPDQRPAFSPAIVVAASNSLAESKQAARYICDGTDDQEELQQAVDDLASTGGSIVIAEGDYGLSDGVLIDYNKRVRIWGEGAELFPDAGVTALKVSQGISLARGVTIVGLFIDGASGAGTVGITFEDTNNSELISCHIENCDKGILLNSNVAGNFVEGSLIDNVTLRNNTTGLEFAIVGGTGSFMQTIIRGLKCVVGASGTGLLIPTSALLVRALIQGTFWIDSSEVAVSIDGNMEDAELHLAIEGSGGSTGNTGLLIGSNATNLDQAFIDLLYTGVIANQIDNASGRAFHYWSGGSQIVQTSGTAVLGYKRHGDATDRIRFEGLTAGGRIQLGNGATLDVNLYRNGADILATDDVFEMVERSAPASPSANRARLFVQDNGSGKTQLCVLFPTGVVQVLATEP